MITIRPVILAGGEGSRLHPLSSPKKPKQFLSLLEDDSPFQDTLERVSGPEFLPPLIIAGQSLEDVVKDQCDEIALDYEELLLEVDRKNTAAACLVAALWAKGRGENFPLLICPSDHFIADQSAFMRAVRDASQTAEEGYMVTFGVVADRPETQYGYIEVGQRLDAGYSGHCVERFVEKPDLATVQELLNAGRYVWNAGIFCCTPDMLISEMEKHSPDHLAPCRQAISTGPILSYPDCPTTSLDVAVMEKSNRVAVVSLLSAWSDLGTWPGLWKALSLV
ncbi:Mannose-1-phosphate guanylyltransferase (fragment) [Candidatus Terasakiella magnetica]|uniref:Mannose-1-phosphate guanylyltransferase n=1 Tax=Candidatus Terasakiella magnetica TaxID=1867952 RepID=A0A1C3RIA4_9PROT